MRYAIFTDVHANLEALEAVLEHIDKLAEEKPIDQIWFLGDLVGYGPNPNECIARLRERTDVIIAGNHDWAAVGKISLEDFSEAARLSAEWTAEQLTDEHRQFLTDLPERIDLPDIDCVLVHGSPYGPIWEYLTNELLAERSFDYFSTRFCFVGHTHVPVIFQKLAEIADIPTIPLRENGHIPASVASEDDDDTAELAIVRQMQQAAEQVEHARLDPLQSLAEDASDLLAKVEQIKADDMPPPELAEAVIDEEATQRLGKGRQTATTPEPEKTELLAESTEPEGIEAAEEARSEDADEETDEAVEETEEEPMAEGEQTEESAELAPTEVLAEEPEVGDEVPLVVEITPEDTIQSAEERLNSEIEEILALLGISSIRVSNEMLIPPEGSWQAPENFRAIVNPGGVGQPRDGDARAAFMIFDTESGFTFYRIPYNFEKTQKKIIKSGLPPYLATRLAFGR
jgi:diadenosine tetraphosphatase ApaH/serine/threonine PP2A family protein phosphatase